MHKLSHAMHGSQSLRDQVAYYDRLGIGHAFRNHKFLVCMVRTHTEQKRGIQTDDALHRNMSRSRALHAPGKAGCG